jgi:hypothetical protein
MADEPRNGNGNGNGHAPFRYRDMFEDDPYLPEGLDVTYGLADPVEAETFAPRSDLPGDDEVSADVLAIEQAGATRGR